MAAAGGQVFLLSQQHAPITTTGDMAGVAGVVDMVGADRRDLVRDRGGRRGGHHDQLAQPQRRPVPTPTTTPRTSRWRPRRRENSNPVPPPPPTEHTIAEIQGTGDTSPLVGDPVITQGVVTAAYPTGGFFGYVLQTDGTGSGDRRDARRLRRDLRLPAQRAP